ncbi:hypothetical protein GGS21DRAFT_183553 [Xylaria nigripes]|nr:hypothetical protein GGS21DRAFT_183553 [Xylaria nigripes]
MMKYTATYPSGNTTVDERVKRFISAFYAMSDDFSRNDEWVGCFMPDALLVMGDKRAKGVDEIRHLRRGMWENVQSRRHRLEKVYPGAFEQPGLDSEWQFEYMLYGSVELDMKSGEKVTGQWAGRAVLKDVEGRQQYAFYQVYLHTTASTPI